MVRLNVTVWNEFRHEKPTMPKLPKYIPMGYIMLLLRFKRTWFNVGTATLDEPEHGLTEEVLAKTDVLIWWGHMAHHEVQDEIVDRVHQ